jgi:transposase
MQPLLTHVAGVDVHKEVLVITTLVGDLNRDPVKETFTCHTFTKDLAAMGEKLISMGIRHVAMESTGVYWKPIYNVWHPMGITITVGNAGHIKNVPGRKTDVKDSEWIAGLHRCGLIRSSFIPDTEYQQLRLLNRHRANLISDLSRIKNRVQQVLEDGNIKISSIVSDVFGAVGMALLDALSNGITDTASLMVRIRHVGTTRIKRRFEMEKAVTNCFREDHCFLIRELMRQYMDLKQRIQEVEDKLDKRFEKHADLLQRLVEIPGVDTITAQGIVAEATTQMENFRTDRLFAAWAGVAPGNHESARKKKEPKQGTVTPLCANS